MSFDIDPVDKHKRILAYHAESDCYFECKTQAEFNNYNEFGEIDDVTDVENHENEYKKRKAKEYTMSKQA